MRSDTNEELVTEAMVLNHWELEKQLTRDLLASLPNERWDVFERSYARLYSELAWLNLLVGKGRVVDNSEYKKWVLILGESSLKIYEVGSGKGGLLSFLAGHKHECKGSDITRERGEKWSSSQPNLSWGITDGVHLNDFEPDETYDVVISNQVIEHLHPDDVLTHMENVHAILKPAGKYIFNTPHSFTGPYDVSRLFGFAVSMGMHLKEYTYREMVNLLEDANFSCIYYAGFPLKVQKILVAITAGKPDRIKTIGKAYLQLVLIVEYLLSTISNRRFRRMIAAIFDKIKLFNANIFLAAEKI